jgi:Leucine-rich repeat (LRR) protein
LDASRGGRGLVQQTGITARHIQELAQKTGELRPTDDTEVIFADKYLEASVRWQLKMIEGLLTRRDLQRLHVLNDDNVTDGLVVIKDLAGLEAAVNLTELDLTNLDLGETAVTDLSPLAGLTHLTELRLYKPGVGDLSPLAGLTNLTNLDLGETAVTDLGPLAGLTNLTNLDLRKTDVCDLGPLAGLTNLRWLVLGETPVTDLSPLAGLTNLMGLTLRKTGVSDLSPLAGLKNLGTLYCRQNPLNQESIDIHIPNLRARGTRVQYD